MAGEAVVLMLRKVWSQVQNCLHLVVLKSPYYIASLVIRPPYFHGDMMSQKIMSKGKLVSGGVNVLGKETGV